MQTHVNEGIGKRCSGKWGGKKQGKQKNKNSTYTNMSKTKRPWQFFSFFYYIRFLFLERLNWIAWFSRAFCYCLPVKQRIVWYILWMFNITCNLNKLMMPASRLPLIEYIVSNIKYLLASNIRLFPGKICSNTACMCFFFVFVCPYYTLIICWELIFTGCYDMDQQRPCLLWEDPRATGNPSSPQESSRILYPAKMKRMTAEWVYMGCKPLQVNHCCMNLSTSSWGTDVYPYFFSVYLAEVIEWAVWTYTDVLFPTSSS